ncbi:MAG: class I tRNA ligase family protein, partial [Endomicrobiales bacterium]
MTKFYITTPIYYVNDFPHIGHAYTTVAADVTARWHRLCGEEAFFLTGTDEHGAKIVQAAEKSGLSPKEFCDRIVGGFKEAWQALDIRYDGFIRTTDPAHESAVRLFLQRLYDSGAIYKGKYEGLYCVQCEKFLSESELNADLCCPDHRVKPVKHSEENYFFRLSAYRDRLLEILTDEHNPQHLAVFPVERRNEIIGKLKVGLEDISISRAALEWGIPLPFDPSQTAYVWIDALLNYITAIGYEQDSEEFRKQWPADVQLMAKDILWFHSVIWAAMLLAAHLPPPRRIFSHGFFTIDGQKMSKTIGNVIRPGDLVKRFGVDASRYLLLSLFPFGTDGDISWTALTERYNTDLANNLGNLASRTITMAEKYFGGKVPSPGGKTRLTLSAELDSLDGYYENLDFYRVIGELQRLIDTANRHIEATAPWKMAREKNPDLPCVI